MLRRYTYYSGRMTYRRDDDGLENHAISPEKGFWVRDGQLREWLAECVHTLSSPNLFTPEEYERKKAEVLAEMLAESTWPYRPTSPTHPPASPPPDPLASPSGKSGA